MQQATVAKNVQGTSTAQEKELLVSDLENTSVFLRSADMPQETEPGRVDTKQENAEKDKEKGEEKDFDTALADFEREFGLV